MVTALYEKLVSNMELTKEQKTKLLKRAVELLGYPKLTQVTNRSKRQIYLYVMATTRGGRKMNRQTRGPRGNEVVTSRRGSQDSPRNRLQ